MPDGLDQINVFTRRYIRTDPQLYDNFFNHDALNYMLRNTFKQNFGGGSTINENFSYDAVPTGGYAKGAQLSVPQKQTEQQLRLSMKFLYAAITLYSEDINVLNVGDLAVTKLIKVRVAEGMQALGAGLSVGQYLNGTGTYINNVNGLMEALNDGTTAGPDGATYTTYGGNTRGGVIGASLNSVPYNVNGDLEYSTLNTQYFNCYQGAGEWEPNTLMTTPKGYSYIQNKMQTQQRFQNVSLGAGFTGMQFNGSTVLASRYCPGSDISTSGTRSNKFALEYLAQTVAPATAYPTITGETLVILNARRDKLNLYLSTDSLYKGGFRDFVPTANSTVVTGLCLMGCNITVPTPYLHQWLFGITS